MEKENRNYECPHLRKGVLACESNVGCPNNYEVCPLQQIKTKLTSQETQEVQR